MNIKRIKKYNSYNVFNIDHLLIPSLVRRGLRGGLKNQSTTNQVLLIIPYYQEYLIPHLLPISFTTPGYHILTPAALVVPVNPEQYTFQIAIRTINFVFWFSLPCFFLPVIIIFHALHAYRGFLFLLYRDINCFCFYVRFHYRYAFSIRVR